MLNVKRLLTATYDDRDARVEMQLSDNLARETVFLRIDVICELLAQLNALYDQTMREADDEIDRIVRGTTLTPTAVRTVAQLAGA